MKAVIFYFRNLDLTPNFYRIVQTFFTIYGGSNIWQDLEYMGRVIVGKRNYIWRRIMKAVTFYFWNLEPIPNLYRFVQPFLPFMVDLMFGKILNIWEE